ncbi:MAG: hypothetical protein QXZ41_05485 [Ignisphaera sp.]|uniref:Uncharacterized protein n=1 Tax=Ignisphaera aggregans TaxID=334771 RepID=A0A7C4JK48_9CREN
MSQPPLSADVPPFAEVIEVKQRIEKLEALVANVDAVKLRLLIELAEAMGFWRCSQCKLNLNNTCTGWRLSQEMANKISGIASADAVVQQDNVYRINLSKIAFVGVFCPIYTPKT